MEFDDELVGKGFTWEQEYEQSWTLLKEDAEGSLQPALELLLQRQSQYLQRRRTAFEVSVRRGLMRHVVLLLDWSLGARDTTSWTLNQVVKPFINKYLEENPLGQLGILFMRDGLASVCSGLSANRNDHETALLNLYEPKGDMSLQNGLMAAQAMLSHVPSHGTREIIFLQTGAFSTNDAGNLLSLPSDLQKSKVRVNAIALWGTMDIVLRMTEKTGGKHAVALDDRNFIELLEEQLAPPPVLLRLRGNGAALAEPSYLVPMGFPNISFDLNNVLCACHGTPIKSPLHECPRCKSVVCQLPIDCPVCHLTLVAAPHLARSYHHLFPIPPFTENYDKEDMCYSCEASESRLSCPHCRKRFCIDCDAFIHEQLHNCPGCLIIN